MRLSLLPLAFIPLLVSAQSSANASQNVVLSTSLFTTVSLGPGRVETTITSNVVVTLTAPPASASQSGNSSQSASQSGNSTVSASGNVTASGSVTSKTATPSNLPNAPTTIALGGASGGAPFPGATNGGCGTACGPDDDYINAAQRQMVAGGLAVTALGVVLGFGIIWL